MRYLYDGDVSRRGRQRRGSYRNHGKTSWVIGKYGVEEERDIPNRNILQMLWSVYGPRGRSLTVSPEELERITKEQAELYALKKVGKEVGG